MLRRKGKVIQSHGELLAPEKGFEPPTNPDKCVGAALPPPLSVISAPMVFDPGQYALGVLPSFELSFQRACLVQAGALKLTDQRPRSIAGCGVVLPVLGFPEAPIKVCGGALVVATCPASGTAQTLPRRERQATDPDSYSLALFPSYTLKAFIKRITGRLFSCSSQAAIELEEGRKRTPQAC